MPATRASTVSSNNPRNHHPRSHSARTHRYDRHSTSSCSDASDLIQYPDVEGIRKIHAEVMEKSSKGRRSESRKVPSSEPQRRRSGARSYMTKETGERAQDSGQRGGLEQRRRLHDVGRRDSRHRSDDVHEAKIHSREERHRRPKFPERSKTSGDVSESRPERSHREGKDQRKRPSERRTSYQEEVIRTPLRRERRSIVEVTEKREEEKPPVRRSTSVVESKTPAILRPFLKRSQTSARELPASKSTAYVAQPRSPQQVRDKLGRASSVRGSRAGDRSSGIFSFMATPKPPKQPEPEERVTCITCLSDDVRVSRCPKLSCSHRMCHSCLRRIFNLSITDPQHMPPKCCTDDCIPLEHVVKLFDNNFKIKWNRKYQEYTTKNRLYCPAKRCGEWIKPSHIHTDTSGGANHGRKYGKCQRCQTKVCCLCNNKWHTTRECPKDAATQEFIKVAKREGWQSCYNCRATVEKIEGCNHMTCRCGAQFCLTCGVKWKGCSCLWFDEQAYDPNNNGNAAYIGEDFPQAHNYQEELDRRRQQELDDEALAREMELRNNLHHHNHHHHQQQQDGFNNDPWEDFGNAAPHFLNEDFRRRAADALSATMPWQPYNHNHNHNNHPPHHQHQHQHQHHQPPQPPQPQHHPRPRPTDRNPNPNERTIPRRMGGSDYASEAERHRPIARERGARASMLAGITRGQTGGGRVDEWRRHVGGVV